MQSAIRIGLLPGELAEKIIPIGNNAGAGARMALESIAFTDKITDVLANAEYIELSNRPDFNEFYVACMEFE